MGVGKVPDVQLASKTLPEKTVSFKLISWLRNTRAKVTTTLFT
jgi:hypothetical protein